MTPPKKRRKLVDGPEEVVFDPEARKDYLTGFRKRKQQRIKYAQEQASKKEREFKIEARKQIREQRKTDLENHVQAVQDQMKKMRQLEGIESEAEESEEEDTTGEQKADGTEFDEDEGHEHEYIDEDKYTTVTVEPLEMSKDTAFEDTMNTNSESEDEDKADGEDTRPDTTKMAKRVWTKAKPETAKPKKKRKKFRYETKHERKAERVKSAVKRSAAARTRRAQ